MVGFIRC